MYTKIKNGEIEIEIPIQEKARNSAIQEYNNHRINVLNEVEALKKMQSDIPPLKYSAVITEDGINHIMSLLPSNRPLKERRYYLNYIEWRLNKILRNGLSLLEFHELTKTYKAKWFKGAKSDFKFLKGKVFLPYVNIDTGKESYIKNSRGKCYRLNPIWVKKYTSFQIDSTPFKLIEKELPPMSDYDKSKCKLMDATTRLISIVPNLVNAQELTNTAESNISSYLLDLGNLTYEYCHSKMGLIHLRMKSKEYEDFLEIESLIQSKYLLQKLTHLKVDSRMAHRNHYEGRLYHKLTNFPKKLYKYLLFDREEIVEIDMANCFPTLLLLAITGKYDPFKLFKGNIYLRSFEIARQDKKNQIYQLVLSIRLGRFYEYITHLIYPKLSEEQKRLKKNYIKTQMSKILFGRYNSTNWIKEKLKKKIPLFIKIIDTQKARYVRSFKLPENSLHYDEFSKNGKKSAFKTGNDIISIIGMRTESLLFLDKIFSNLVGIPFLTKHDAILCPKSRASEIRERMIDVLDVELGKGNYLLKTTDLTNA